MQSIERYVEVDVVRHDKARGATQTSREGLFCLSWEPKFNCGTIMRSIDRSIGRDGCSRPLRTGRNHPRGSNLANWVN